MTVADLIVAAYTEIRVGRAGDVLSPMLMANGLLLYNAFLDSENADRRAVWADDFQTFTLPTNTVPVTIGPGAANFVVAQRPVAISAAQVDLGGGPPDVFRHINIRSKQWYASKSVPGLTSTFPTDLYYSPDWQVAPVPPTQPTPYGNLYFWPVPTTAYQVRLWLRVLLANVTNAAGTTFSNPQGYLQYHRLSLAKLLAPGNGQGFSSASEDMLREAQARVFALNDETPALHTQDGGLGSVGTQRTAFNWLDRSTSGAG